MKLTYFSAQTLPKLKGAGKGSPKVSFGKAGTISFNGAACQLMALKAGDKVTLSQDDENPENFYFFKDTANGFELREGYDKKGCLFNHSVLVDTFLEALQRDTSITHSFLMAGIPTEMKGDKAKTQYWGILINS